MGARRTMHTFVPSNSAPSYQAKNARGFRNLMSDQLGGVVFGCTSTTMKECLEKQLFGQLFGPNMLAFEKEKLRQLCAEA